MSASGGGGQDTCTMTGDGDVGRHVPISGWRKAVIKARSAREMRRKPGALMVRILV
jgi:hypothetical protein